MSGKVCNIVRKTPKQTGGYFFILDEEGKERFAHHTSLENVRFKELQDGASVEFTPVRTTDGKLRAESVRVLS